MPEPSGSRRTTALALAAGWTALVLVLCMLPGRLVPTARVPHEDKVGHFAMFAGLGLLWMAGSATGRRGRWEGLLVWAGGTALGVAIEFLQGWMANGRTAAATDALADTIGLIVGIWGYLAAARWIAKGRGARLGGSIRLGP